MQCFVGIAVFLLCKALSLWSVLGHHSWLALTLIAVVLFVFLGLVGSIWRQRFLPTLLLMGYAFITFFCTDLLFINTGTIAFTAKNQTV